MPGPTAACLSRPTIQTIGCYDLGGSSFDAVEDGLFEAKALVGKGTVVVEQARLVKDLNGICDGSDEDPDCI